MKSNTSLFLSLLGVPMMLAMYTYRICLLRLACLAKGGRGACQRNASPFIFAFVVVLVISVISVFTVGAMDQINRLTAVASVCVYVGVGAG